MLYEKYEDRVDSFGETAIAEIKKQYAVFDAKVLSKIPRGPLKDKKKDWSGDKYVVVGFHQCFVKLGLIIS